MPEKKLSRYEKETIITFNEEEALATIWTSSPRLIEELDKRCASNDTYKSVFRNDISGRYTCPKKLCYPRKPRLLSEETRLRMRQRGFGGKGGKETDIN